MNSVAGPPKGDDFDALYMRIIKCYLSNQPLAPQENQQLFPVLLSGISDVKKAAILTLLSDKMTQRPISEILSLYHSILSHAQPVPPFTRRKASSPSSHGFHDAAREKPGNQTPPSPPICLDTCGTGGSSLPTLNVSTILAFALARLAQDDDDVPFSLTTKSSISQPKWVVLKHGNRSISGKCGSMDFLDQLEICYTPNANRKLIAQYHLGFLFAPDYHPVFAALTTIRRALKFPTIFNWLGPLANPAHLHWQMIGVSNPRMVWPTQELLQGIGRQRTVIIHGLNTMDEVSLSGQTQIICAEPPPIKKEEKQEMELRHPAKKFSVKESFIHPEDFGVSPRPREAYQGGTPKKNLQISAAILRGEKDFSLDHCNHLAINLAVALVFLCKWFSEKEKKEAFDFAHELLRSGKIWNFMQQYRASSHGHRIE